MGLQEGLLRVSRRKIIDWDAYRRLDVLFEHRHPLESLMQGEEEFLTDEEALDLILSGILFDDNGFYMNV